VKTLARPPVSRSVLIVLAAVLLLSGCSRGRRKGEPAYVAAAQVSLRDRLANVYNKVGEVKNAERVEILDRDRRFAFVRTAAGVEGWMEQRYLVSQKVFDAFQKLAADAQSAPIQSFAITRNETNLHLTPGRDTDRLYQSPSGAKLAILKRAVAEKRLPGAPARPATGDGQSPPVPLEDWWLVRDSEGHTGWILARMVDVDVPLEVAQYAEGQRIVAAMVLNQVRDGDRQVPQYLMLLTEPKDGMPYDYNQFRVFTWNVKKHRYETAYRERNLQGVLPVTVRKETFEKDGELPVFVVRVRDAVGNVAERKYVLNTPIVRRVTTPADPASNRKR
jgi:SH3-like domain-containing protein